MPSRKRAKGRERKLKQQAREPVERSVSQPPPNGGNVNLTEQSIRRLIERTVNVQCYHGSSITLREHPVNVFMDSFLKTMKNCNVSVKESLGMTLKKHQEVWKDDTIKKMVIDRMASLGTDSIIEGNEFARMISEAIILLEHLDSKGNYHSALSKTSEDIAYLLNARERDVIHFYKKRIPCSCLDELYSEIKKSQVRGSTCYHCKQTVNRKDVKTCSRCKFVQYCSKECQISDWPTHKEKCVEAADFHKGVKKAETVKRNEKRV